MKPLRIAICEDIEADAAELNAMIDKSGVLAETILFTSGHAFLAAEPAGRFDLVFLDIYMDSLTGVETARKLRKSDHNCGVVFTTSSRDHMLEAFDVGAEHYLVKPIEQSRLEKVLANRRAILAQRQEFCIVNARGSYVEIPLDEICYVEVHNHNCIVHTILGEIETGSSMTIEDFQIQLSAPQFYRCHKSYIVNFSHVAKVSRDFVMKNGDTVYIRRRDVARCEHALDKWRLAEARL